MTAPTLNALGGGGPGESLVDMLGLFLGVGAMVALAGILLWLRDRLAAWRGRDRRTPEELARDAVPSPDPRVGPGK